MKNTGEINGFCSFGKQTKKMILLFLLQFFFINSYSQINNLKDLLDVSGLSVYELTSNLQYSWEVGRPTEKYINDGKNVESKYPFTHIENNVKQLLQRRIITHIETGYNRERTVLICNDQALLKSVQKNLPYNGFQQKQKKPHKTVYHDGNTMIAITDEFYSEEPLKKGFYMITVFTN